MRRPKLSVSERNTRSVSQSQPFDARVRLGPTLKRRLQRHELSLKAFNHGCKSIVICDFHCVCERMDFFLGCRPCVSGCVTPSIPSHHFPKMGVRFGSRYRARLSRGYSCFFPSVLCDTTRRLVVTMVVLQAREIVQSERVCKSWVRLLGKTKTLRR